MACNKIYIDTDTTFWITGLKNVVADSFVDDAVCTMQLFKDGVQIGDDIVMTAVGSDGNYWGILPESNTIDPNDTYYLIVTIVSTYTVTKKIFLTSEWSS